MARRDVRSEMIQGAAALLAAHGVQGTSFALLIEATDAPRGSIYHHFPGGKAELVQQAAASVGAAVEVLLDRLQAATPAEVVDVFVEGWRSVLTGGHYERGCVVAAVCLGAGDDDELRRTTEAVFDGWTRSLAGAFVRAGTSETDATDLAALCIAAVEGALIVGRASRSDQVFTALHRQLTRLVSC